MWVMLKKSFLKAFSYSDILLSPPLDMLIESSGTNLGETCGGDYGKCALLVLVPN